MDSDETPAGEPRERPGREEAEEIRYLDGRIEHPRARHERKDIRLGCLLSVIVTALCVVAALGYGVWRFFWWEAGSQQAAKRSPYPLAPAPSTTLPPEPRLEQLDLMTPEESAAVNEQLAAQEKALHRYGPTAEKGFVQIPIERAMKAVAGRLPVSKESSPGRDANGLLDAGQSNSGRIFRGP